MKIDNEAGTKPLPKIVDFSCAMVAKDGITSITLFGDLPCQSPEMLCASVDSPYLPKPGDCWSLGVLLLEIAGGKGSFFKALDFDKTYLKRLSSDMVSPMQLCDTIIKHFQ